MCEPSRESLHLTAIASMIRHGWVTRPWAKALRGRTYASRSHSRRERVANGKMQSHVAFHHLVKEFQVLNKNVTKVVDLGYAPGVWFEYTRQALLSIHGVSCDHIYKKCTMIGFDLLFTQPPPGTYSTQGSIFSQRSQDNVLCLLKEAALRGLSVRESTSTSPLTEEMEERSLPGVDDRLQELSAAMGRLGLHGQQPDSDVRLLYQADLILSDLCSPLLQESGFFNNTQSYPFIRSIRNRALRLNYTHPHKMSIDLAEAALLLCGEALGKGGSFVARLSRVDLRDPELALLESRLAQVFESVTRWSPDNITTPSSARTQDLFLVCQGKRHSTMDKYAVFSVK